VRFVSFNMRELLKEALEPEEDAGGCEGEDLTTGVNNPSPVVPNAKGGAFLYSQTLWPPTYPASEASAGSIGRPQMLEKLGEVASLSLDGVECTPKTQSKGNANRRERRQMEAAAKKKEIDARKAAQGHPEPYNKSKLHRPTAKRALGASEIPGLRKFGPRKFELSSPESGSWQGRGTKVKVQRYEREKLLQGGFEYLRWNGK
jgi:hypothetical protein